MSQHDKVIAANIHLHSILANSYQKSEPHFKTENQERVLTLLTELAARAGNSRLLDLGCGTGFIVELAKGIFDSVVGVDATESMLNLVPSKNDPRVTLVKSTLEDYSPPRGEFNIVSCYSFAHHLFDPNLCFKRAYEALSTGGIFYMGLEPNFYFWEAINGLRDGQYNEVIQRERGALIAPVTLAGISPELYNLAEIGKNLRGGFKEERLREDLAKIGFQDIEIHYEWFLGQGKMMNDPTRPRDTNIESAQKVDACLKEMLPLSRHLFKYLFVMARK